MPSVTRNSLISNAVVRQQDSLLSDMIILEIFYDYLPATSIAICLSEGRHTAEWKSKIEDHAGLVL